MTPRRKKLLLGLLASFLLLATAVGALALVGARASSHPTQRAELGAVRSSADMEALLETPGPVRVETVLAADWEVDRAGLINLDHPEAERAGLTNGPEPIQIYFHVLRHPERGAFLIDTGVERALMSDPDSAAIRGLVARFMNIEKLAVRTDTKTFVEREPKPIAGVLMTHLHLDHVSGMQDVPKGTPIFTGPGEAGARSGLNLFVQGSTDRALAGHEPLSELAFDGDGSGRFAGVLDLFGDGSVWALWVPGHTPGSVAYLARTNDGPVLFVGDTCHTAWGWNHGVEPGQFTADQPANAASLLALRELVERHPSIQVRLGHQEIGAQGAATGVAAR